MIAGVLLSNAMCISYARAQPVPDGETTFAYAGQADDRQAIFMVQARHMTNLGEEAESLVRCGIRSRAWSDRLLMAIHVGVVTLADRLWPDSLRRFKVHDPSPPPPGDDGGVHDDALQEALHLLAQASERGRNVAPECCGETGPAIATHLDGLVGER